MRITRSWLRTFRSALLLGTMGVAAACGGDRKEDAPAEKGGRGAAAGQPERGGTAILVELADMDKPIPFIFDTSLDGDLSDVMYMPLLRGAWRGGRLAFLTSHDSPMSLAWHWEYVGADSAAIRYRMRSGLKWSDGEPITAQDVVWTYQMVRDPRVASPRQEYVERMDSVKAENDSTVVFYFKARYPDMLFHSGLPIAPKHAFQGVDPSQIRSSPRVVNPANGNMVVSGPFMIGQWNKGERIVLVPNPRFPIRPNLDQIVIRVIPEATTRLVELQTGHVDFVRPIPFEQVPLLRSQAPNVRFEKEQKRFYDYVGYNPKTFAPFADRDVRLALGLAVDVPAMLRALQMQEYTVPAGGPYAPIFTDLYDPRTQAPLPFDTARARQILASKGWRDTDGDGVLDKDGKPFRFTLLTNAGNQRRADVSQILQQDWKRIGVDARLQAMETNTVFDRLRKKEFQAAIMGWGVGLSPDLSELWSKDNPNNYVSYDNPKTFELFRLAREQKTPEQANRYWKEAAAQIVQDRPYTWLYYMDQLDGVNNRLRGMKIDTYGAYQNTWEWWIPKSQQSGPSAR